MSIHKEGYKILGFGFVALLVLNVVINVMWGEIEILKWGFLIL
jgi:hypothetical protein